MIMGPMFSGKTTELIRRLKRYKIARYECLIVKYARDTRYASEGLATHDRQSINAVSVTDLMSLAEKAADYDVIGIDEGQFFPDVVNFCEDLANAGKTVIVAGKKITNQKM
jgi:thymidine kinase